jgi:outer membrane protein insertion porin family
MTSRLTTIVAVAAALSALGAAVSSSASELEESRPYVGSIRFIGNEHVDDGKLKSLMRTREPGFFQLFNRPRYRPDFLQSDLAAIEAYYHKNGYYDVVVAVAENRYDEVNDSQHIVIEVEEGEQTLVGGVRITGNNPFKPGELLDDLSLKPGAPFDSTLIGADVYRIRNRMWDEGFVLAEIGRGLAVSDHRAYLTYDIDQGPRMRVREVEITGNDVAKEDNIREWLSFRPGEVFSLKKVQDSQQHLFDTSLFRQVNLVLTQVDTLQRAVDLRVEVEERKMSYVELGIGVGTEDNGRVAAEWGHRHIPGLGGKLQLNTELAFDVVRDDRADFESRYTRFGAAYTGPRFPGTRFSTAVDAFYEQDRNPKTVDYDLLGFGIHGRRRMGRRTLLYIDFGDEFIERKIPPLEGNPFGRTSDETRSLTFTLDRDTRDDLLFPSDGAQRSISVKLAGGPLRADNYFIKTVGSLATYKEIFGGVVLAARVRAGLVSPYGKSDDGVEPDGIPFEDRFYAGGSNSVRGYGENSLGPRLPVGDPGSIDPREEALRGNAYGGEALLLTNVELRFPVWKRAKIGGVLFLDGGNVWENPSDVKLGDFEPVREMEGGGYAEENVTKYRYSFGIGLRYNTPIGPLRLDYGVPVSRTGEIRSTGMFHFNLGHAF